jgi:hypothetical protein
MLRFVGGYKGREGFQSALLSKFELKGVIHPGADARRKSPLDRCFRGPDHVCID